MAVISSRRAAEILNVSQRRVQALVAAGSLKGEKVAGRWMLDEASVERRAKAPKLSGRPKMGQKDLLHLKRYTLMCREHEALDFIYDRQRQDVQILEVHDARYAPAGSGPAAKGEGSLGVAAPRPNRYDLREWIAHRYMPALRPEARSLLRAANVNGTDELMFGSLGLNLSDQYWFRPEGTQLTWGEVNFFQNGYHTAAAGAWRTPDSSTPGALTKRWERIDGVDCLLKGAATGECREPYNEVLATRLLARLLPSDEFVTYTLVEREGRVCSSCPTFATAETEFVSATELQVYAGMGRSESFYHAYRDALKALGVDAPEQALAKMIVCDYLMANFDRHRGNFGLMRNAETRDGWRIAPLFDNGAGFYARVTLRELQARRYVTYTSHPFSEYPSQQLAMVEDMSWYDPRALDGFDEEIRYVLGANAALPKGFANTVAEQVRMNAERVEELARERA